MKKIAAVLLLVLMFLMTSCIRRYPDPEGADARDVSEQTVKIYGMAGGTQLVPGPDGSVLEVPKILKWSGSGVVIATHSDSSGKGESLVISAGHVVSSPKLIVEETESGEPFVMKVEVQAVIVETLDGRRCSAELIYDDMDNDVGVIKVDCIAGVAAEVLDKLPPIGASVIYAGAPFGVHPKGLFIVEDGRYVGQVDGDEAGERSQEMITNPAVGGASGSGIFYHGKLFAILTRVHNGFHHITLAVPLIQVKHALEESKRAWHAH